MDETTTTTPMASDRREKFEADIAQVRVKTGTAAGEQRLITVGIALMVIGAAIALLAALSSGGQSDTRDILTLVVFGVFGLSLVIAGAAVFLRYSIGRFLRFWLLRMIYEQQS